MPSTDYPLYQELATPAAVQRDKVPIDDHALYQELRDRPTVVYLHRAWDSGSPWRRRARARG